jgi:hypothetical protein
LAIGGFVINNFKKSNAYKEAVAHAMSNEQVRLQTGGVTGTGYLVGGEITDSSAELNFTVRGIKKDLNMYYDLTKSQDGSWVVRDFSFEE